MPPVPFLRIFHQQPRAALFLSGSGTNAEKLLESLSVERFRTWTPSVLVTDAPESSAALEIGKRFNVPVAALDIRRFYRERGETRVSLLTERGREIREEWTQTLREMIAPCEIDFGILAGFVPLTNLTNDFPCLNVHPGDLTVTENGQRILAGLHTLPIETAILKGHTALRSSVIVAQPYTGHGGEMDSGPVLGLSAPVPIDFEGESIETLRRWACERPSKRPVGGYKDALEALASRNQTRLKEWGDWTVFPPAVADFAANRFAFDPEEGLFYRPEETLIPVKTVIYTVSSLQPVPRES